MGTAKNSDRDSAFAAHEAHHSPQIDTTDTGSRKGGIPYSFDLVDYATFRADLKELLDQHKLDSSTEALWAMIDAHSGVRRANASATSVHRAKSYAATQHSWPTETYSYCHKKYGWNIIKFLEELYQPLIEAGMVTRKALREHDPSAATGIDNYTRHGRRLPEHVNVPTERELNSQALAALDLDRTQLMELGRLAYVARGRGRNRGPA